MSVKARGPLVYENLRMQTSSYNEKTEVTFYLKLRPEQPRVLERN